VHVVGLTRSRAEIFEERKPVHIVSRWRHNVAAAMVVYAKAQATGRGAEVKLDD
jgi:hypothetical protein